MVKKTAAKKTAVKNIVKGPTAVTSVPTVVPKIHPLIVAFVVYHVLAITLYALPKPSNEVMNGTAEPRGSDAALAYNAKNIKESVIFSGYLYPTGFWQYWDMFAPDPAQTDIWCDAEVTFLDGTKTIFKYPRMKSLSIPEKYLKERYRKFYERVNSDAWPFFWPPFAQAIAYKSASDPAFPPVKVTLVRHFQEVMRHDKQKPVEPPYISYPYFTYVVDQHKLFTDKGWKLGIH